MADFAFIVSRAVPNTIRAYSPSIANHTTVHHPCTASEHSTSMLLNAIDTEVNVQKMVNF